MSQGKSISGTRALPHWEQRKKAPDTRGAVERAVAQAWAQENVRRRSLNFGRVPIDDLCPTLKRGKNGEVVLDDQALRAINSTIQYLFGTNVGRAVAEQLFAVESEVFQAKKAKKERARKPVVAY